MTTLQDGVVLMLEETYGILDGSQDLAGVDKDDHSRIHEQLGIIPVVALLLPLHRMLSRFNGVKEINTAWAYKVSESSESVHC